MRAKTALFFRCFRRVSPVTGTLPEIERAVLILWTLALRSAALPLIGVGGWRALVEPAFECVHGVGQTPFFKNGSRHGGDRAGRFRRVAPLGAAEQPRFECFWRWILLDHTLEQSPLDGQADGIRRLVALTASPASLGR